MKRLILALTIMLSVSAAGVYAQKIGEPQAGPKTSSAYCDLILRKVKVEADLTNLLSEYSKDHPSARAMQFELDALKAEMEEMAAMPESKAPKLTSGYASLILRKVTLESEVQTLLLENTSSHPAVRSKQTELNLLRDEIKKILE